ncbi:ATP-binding protein [Actinomadura viridis]|uniref:ATP-binding protein n=1 Tax=Actinomadura viridis TaxID=58110 RepID=UPI00368F00D9
MAAEATMAEAETTFPARVPDRGGCAAVRLPPDGSIAAVARAGTALTLERLGLPDEDVANATLMASELATNALQHGSPRSPDGRLLPAHPAELWIYLRGTGGGGRELAVKVFDRVREWRPPADTGVLAEHGRGLLIIEALTAGRWGHHPTRSRLARPAVPGKATWFALPVSPEPRPPEHHAPPRPDAAYAAQELHALLAERGLTRLIRRNGDGVSVLSVKENLTVWCEPGWFRWRTPDGAQVRLPRGDITEVCERIVQLHESTAPEPDLSRT